MDNCLRDDVCDAVVFLEMAAVCLRAIVCNLQKDD